MLLAMVLAAMLSVERAPLDPADAVVAVRDARVVVLQRGPVLWTFEPATGREKRVAADSMFIDAKIERAFAGANKIYVAAGTALYDVGLSKRLVIGYPLRSVHVAPDGRSAILETQDGPSIWLRFRDNEWKELPKSWSFSEEFARGGAWAVFVDMDEDGYDTRAVDMATGELQLPQEPKPPREPTPEEPVVVYVSFGPEVDLGDEPPIESQDVTSGAVKDAWRALARQMMAELPPLTVEEAKTLESTGYQDNPRVHPSFDGRAAILELPVSMSEEDLGVRGLSYVPYRVRWYTILVLPDGSRHELRTRLPRDAKLFVDESGSFLMVREKGQLEHGEVKLP
jgi:hypothetical protein